MATASPRHAALRGSLPPQIAFNDFQFVNTGCTEISDQKNIV
jgi:hypothetical protein